MRRDLYRRILDITNRQPDSRPITILTVFPAATFADAPYWTPGDGYEICIPNRTWLKDNRDGTVEAVASYVTPKIGLRAWDGSDWTEPELWTVRAPADHWWLTTVLWDKPHRITHFLTGLDEDDGLLMPPSEITNRVPNAGHPIEAVLEYWEAFSLRWKFTPRRLEAFPGVSDLYGLVAHAPSNWGSDINEVTLSELVYKIARIAREFQAEVYVFLQPS